MESPPTLREQRREVRRLKHRSFRTEEADVRWVKRFLVLHDKRHPQDMGAAAMRTLLSHLATPERVAASTPNNARKALLLLDRSVLTQPLPPLDDLERATRPHQVPTVLRRTAVQALRAELSGLAHLMGRLLYGSGLRLMECGRLRVKDVDGPYHQSTARDGKGAQDRVTRLPRALALVAPLQRHLARVTRIHEDDLLEGYDEVYWPYAFKRTAPHAGKAWVWQDILPGSQRSSDPRSGMERRHHISETV